MEGGSVAQLFPERAFFAAEGGGREDVEHDKEIAALTGFVLGQALGADTEFLAAFTACWNTEFDGAIESGDDNLSSEYGFPWGKEKLMVKIRIT